MFAIIKKLPIDTITITTNMLLSGMEVYFCTVFFPMLQMLHDSF